MSSQSFRAGVVIVIRRENGDLMSFERKDVPGSWQLPQGGIDVGEEPVDAAWRELVEETGLTESDVALVLELPEWIAYEWPADIRSNMKNGDQRRGQIQKWFLFGVIDEHSVAPRPDDHEFSRWQWMDPHHLIIILLSFVKPHTPGHFLGSCRERSV